VLGFVCVRTVSLAFVFEVKRLIVTRRAGPNNGEVQEPSVSI
jgi:hypothetical protein